MKSHDNGTFPDLMRYKLRGLAEHYQLTIPEGVDLGNDTAAQVEAKVVLAFSDTTDETIPF